MIDPSTYTLYIQKPHSIEVHHPVNSVYQFSHHQNLSYMPINTIPAKLNFTTNTTTILPFSTSAKPPPSPNPSTFLSYIHSLPQWEQLLLEWVQLHTDAFTLASHLSQSENTSGLQYPMVLFSTLRPHSGGLSHTLKDNI